MVVLVTGTRLCNWFSVCSFPCSLPHVLFINIRLSSGLARSILFLLLFLLFLLFHFFFVTCGICSVFDTSFLIHFLKFEGRDRPCKCISRSALICLFFCFRKNALMRSQPLLPGLVSMTLFNVPFLFCLPCQYFAV